MAAIDSRSAITRTVGRRVDLTGDETAAVREEVGDVVGAVEVLVPVIGLAVMVHLP